MEELTKMIKSIRRKMEHLLGNFRKPRGGERGGRSKPTRKEASNNNRGYNRYNHEAF